ncbi:MAG: hypothetical protein K0S33_2287 [Bacteroidetes bacterium]|nr:hypothetical protein [Bacteroidota bacterium]
MKTEASEAFPFYDRLQGLFFLWIPKIAVSLSLHLRRWLFKQKALKGLQPIRTLQLMLRKLMQFPFFHHTSFYTTDTLCGNKRCRVDLINDITNFGKL